MSRRQGAAEISRAKSAFDRAEFAVSASRMQQGNLTAPGQTHTQTARSPHTRRDEGTLCAFSH